MPRMTSIPVVLESGDRLSREEFHRRYCARPDIRRAELIQGVVYVPFTERYDLHNKPNVIVLAWLSAHVLRHPGIEHGGGATIYLSADSEVQPDAFLFYTQPRHARGLRRTADGYLEGAPNLVVEIAASSASYDLHDKRDAYRAAGVPEYAVWRTIDGALDWFRLKDGEYVRVEPDAGGKIESAEFPGLRLHVASLLAGDLAGVVAALEAPSPHEDRP